MSMQHLKEGFDPTAEACITTAMLLQMIRNAQPYPSQGFIIWSASAPDVVTNPELEDFLWGEISGGNRTQNIYYYNGTSWELIPLELLDGSVTLAKLSLAGTTPYYIIQVNAAGTQLVWTSIPSAIQDNTLPAAKLLVTDNNNRVMTSIAGTKSFQLFADFLNALADNTLPIAKMVRGGAAATKNFLATLADGSAVEWTTLDIANILAAGLTAGQSLRRNAGNTAWEGYDATDIGTKVYGQENTPGATQNVTVVKPTDKTWKSYRLVVFFEVTGESSGTMKVDFTYETAPLAGTTAGSYGNGGVDYTRANDVDDHQVQFEALDNFPAQLEDLDSVTFRATLTNTGGATVTVQRFMVEAIYA